MIPAIIAPILLRLFKRVINLEEINQQLHHQIVERQRAEQSAQQRAVHLQAISDLAVECAAATPDTDLPQLIAERLRAFTGVMAVSISIYDAQTQALTVQHVAVSGPMLSAFNQILGQNIIGMINPVSPEMLQRMVAEVVNVSNDLSEVTFGIIPQPIATIAQKTFGIGSFTGLALCYGNELWGTAVIVSRAHQQALERDVALTFAYVAALALRRQKVEQDLHQREEQLKTKNAELERFTYTVSHDLKSPLITIGGFVGFLEQDVRSGNVERVRADVIHINDALTRMRLLLDELLELSRIGRVMNPPEAVSFEAIAQEAVEAVRGRTAVRGIQVEIASGLPIVYGDRVRLVEVVQNLLDNACKFTSEQPRPRVEIGARQDGDETVFYVRDNGIGIAPQYHDKVFDLFEKLDPQSEGTGIGLALVKRIVETHGG
ncbi:MAG: sensor histidine kinase, partial [Anaerolineae bacterium]